jgi:hypothetical protein
MWIIDSGNDKFSKYIQVAGVKSAAIIELKDILL